MAADLDGRLSLTLPPAGLVLHKEDLLGISISSDPRFKTYVKLDKFQRWMCWEQPWIFGFRIFTLFLIFLFRVLYLLFPPFLSILFHFSFVISSICCPILSLFSSSRLSSVHLSLTVISSFSRLSVASLDLYVSFSSFALWLTLLTHGVISLSLSFRYRP